MACEEEEASKSKYGGKGAQLENEMKEFVAFRRQAHAPGPQSTHSHGDL